MIIGEIVETLISIRDSKNLDRHTDNAVCAACNILDKLPRLTEDEEVKKRLEEVFRKN